VLVVVDHQAQLTQAEKELILQSLVLLRKVEVLEDNNVVLTLVAMEDQVVEQKGKVKHLVVEQIVVEKDSLVVHQ
tara:strand:- start:254 stop:478 length:225 start_codon:yes stop_codon:yes gene_type:complete